MRCVLGAFLTMVGFTFFGFGLADFLGFDPQTGADLGFSAAVAILAYGLIGRAMEPHGPEEG